MRAVLLLVSGLALMGMLAAKDVSVQAGGIRPTVHAVALEGDPAPGTSANFSPCLLSGAPNEDNNPLYTFDEPMTNAAGYTTFFACLSDGSWGFFLTPFNGPTTAIVRGGETIPGVGTLHTSSLDASGDGPAINNRGSVLFVIRAITGPGAPDSALFMKPLFGDLHAVVRTGDPSPCGGTFHSFNDMALNDKDHFAFIATYDNPTSKSGVFLSVDGTISSVLCNGDPLPGTGTPNETFTGAGTADKVGVDGPYINNSDTVLVMPDALSGPQVTDPENPQGDTESKWAGSVWARRPGQPIETFIMVGDPIPDSVGGGVVHGIGVGRPAFNDDGVLGFNLSRTTNTPQHPAEQFIASKKLGGSSIDICLEDLGPVPEGPAGYTFEGFGATTINQKGDLAFGAEIDTNPASEDPNNPEADNIRGLFTCKSKVLTTVVRQSDTTKPRGGQWSHVLEETSSYGPFVVFDDEVNATGASPNRGVFLAGSQENPIQGNFLCPDGHVDVLDTLHLLQFVAGVPGILAASSSCPTLGQTEPISGFKWGDVNCDGSVDVTDVTFMLADRAGVPRTPAVASCIPIGQVIT